MAKDFNKSLGQDTEEFTEITQSPLSHIPHRTIKPNRFPSRKVSNEINKSGITWAKSNADTLNEKIISRKSTFMRKEQKNRRSEPPISISGLQSQYNLSDDSVSEYLEGSQGGEIPERTHVRKNSSTFQKFARKKMGS